MASTHKNGNRFKAGDWVTFRYGTRNPVAQIAEARGALGVNGRRLYGIRVYRESDEPDLFELPEDELHAAVPDKSEVVSYLKNHLIEILGAGYSGGRNRSKVWLTYAAGGGMIHTFEPGRGVLGGDAIPCFALHGDKVFAPKKDDVESFLRSFGLTPTEAADVLSAAGTAP